MQYCRKFVISRGHFNSKKGYDPKDAPSLSLNSQNFSIGNSSSLEIRTRCCKLLTTLFIAALDVGYESNH